MHNYNMDIFIAKAAMMALTYFYPLLQAVNLGKTLHAQQFVNRMNFAEMS